MAYLVQGGAPPDDSVTTVKIKDVNVTTAKLAANAVDETKLKDALVADFTEVTVAAGDSILLGDVNDSGNTKRDTVQGILDLVPAAGGAMTLLETLTPSGAASATLTATAIFNDTYDRIVIHIVGFSPAADGYDFHITVSDDGGSSFESGSYAYHAQNPSSGGTGYSATASSSAAYMIIDNPGSAATENGEWLIYVSQLNSTAWHKLFTWIGGCFNGAGDVRVNTGGGSWKGGTAAINQIRFISAGGNITATIRAYGIKDS
jgi:hypothetical protein